MGQIAFVCGSANSERTTTIDALWRKHGDKAILLTPTERLARTRQNLLVREKRLPGLFGKHAWELTAFARTIVEASGQQVHMLSMLERRLIAHEALFSLPSNMATSYPAVTPGLVRHLLQIITELKQAAIEPAVFRNTLINSSHQGVFDELVAAVYDRYQAALLSEGCYDVPGLYWEAERCCKEETYTLPNNADTVLLDGFDDFTLSQQRFLAALSMRVERLVIGLHYDADPDRRDLFQLQQRWVETFTSRMGATTQALSSREPQDYIQYVAQHLFWRNTPPSPVGLSDNVRLMPCADVQHEIETMARHVKQLLTQRKVPPQQIAVSMIDMESHRGAVRAVFEGFGIPLALRVSPTLLSTAVGAFVMRLFEALGTWERRTVTSLLASPLLGASQEEEPLIRAFPLLSRLLGVLMGQQEFIRALENTSEPKEFRKYALNFAAVRELFQRRFRKVEDLSKTLPEEATITRFAKILDKEIEALLSPAVLETIEDDGMAQLETAALRALHTLLEQIASAARRNIPVNRAAFAHFLQEAMSEAHVQVRHNTGPGVCCCTMDGLRHEQFEYVFLGGLNEGTLPRTAPINAVYSESDRTRLGRMHLELPGRYEHTYRERLAFCHAVNAAQKHLTLSWRKQDGRGREVLPSPFVVDIQDMFEKHGVVVTHDEPGPDCFVPEPEQAASPRDLAKSAYYRKEASLLSSLPQFTEIAAVAGSSIEIESKRNGTKPFDKYDGCITAADLLTDLADKYGEDRQFSVSMLEKYLRFPFAFFMERVLDIRESETPENELDAMTRGSILHDALYRFHRHYAGLSVKHLLAKDEDEVRSYMAHCVRAAFKTNTTELAAVPDVILRIEQRRITDVLQRYLTRTAEDFDDTLMPSYFEVGFGRAPRDDADNLHTTEPFTLNLDGNKVLLTGKIDRIDTNTETARIIDYKASSTPSAKHIKAGLDLQLSVYAWAVEQHLLPETSCSAAWYYSIFGDKKQDALLRKKETDFAERETNVKTNITQAIRGIRSGHFPPMPDPVLKSNEVRASTAARYEEWRIERKTTKKQS